MPNNMKIMNRLAIMSIPISLIVLGLKYFAFYVTDSVALYSDAVESIVNVIAAFMAWFAIRISHKPADHNHPYGHHKAEYFSAVIEGVLIIIAALLILNEAWGAIKSPPALEQPTFGLIINFIASAVNSAWALILIRTARKVRSPALLAEGQHLMTDVFTSVGVLIGLFGAILTGWYILDPLLAIIVAVNILWQGWKVINNSVQGLMDVGVELHETIRIRDIISANATGAIEAHDLRTRLAGQLTFIEFHLVVPAVMSVGDAHQICDRIEEALQQEIQNSKIVIHIEPEDEAKLPLGTNAVPFA